MSGIFGVKTRRDCGAYLLTGIFSLQNRGENFCGAVSRNRGDFVSYRYEGKVLESFSDEDVRRLKGGYGIGNVNPLIKQPISFDSCLGRLSLTYSGKILNKRALANQLKKRGHSLSLRHTDVETIGKLMTEDSLSVVDGLEKMARQVRGVYSLGVLSEEGLYAFRSPVGVEPLVIGSNEDFAGFSSESCALKELGLRQDEYRNVNPGEIVHIGREGIKTMRQLEGKKALCGFEPGYWGRIDSIFDGISTKKARELIGRALAGDDKKREFIPDIVIPVRESGVGQTIGYHHGSGAPYDEGLFKNWYVTRTFVQATKAARLKGTDRKQSVIEDAVKDKIVVIVDDSIREGTTIRDKLIPLLSWGGAKEVHVRIGSPQNKYYCRFSVFPKGRGKLLSAGKEKEEQRKFIGADSLEFISLEDYVEALGVPKENLCLGCWTGEFPT